jgi:hypothetical protein
MVLLSRSRDVDDRGVVARLKQGKRSARYGAEAVVPKWYIAWNLWTKTGGVDDPNPLSSALLLSEAEVHDFGHCPPKPHGCRIFYVHTGPICAHIPRDA